MANGEQKSGEQVNGPEVKKGVAWVGTRLKQVTYTVVEGHAVVEGCIMLGPEEQVRQITEAVAKAQAGGETFGVGLTDPIYRWPHKTVPYDIDRALPNKERVTKAIEHWRQHAPIRFVERTANNNHLYPHWVTFRPGGGCMSSVGCRGTGQQFVTLGPNCTTGNAIHEIGHTVGLFHEQSREDRDQFVKIILTKVPQEYRHNFNQHIIDGTDFGAYDYGSIMHYPRTAFSTDGSDTVVPT